MIGKKLSVKRMFFWLTAGMTLTMTAIILVAFFLTKNIVVLWVGMALIVCAIPVSYTHLDVYKRQAE